MPPCTLTWYDKMKKPSASLVKQDNLPRNGCILVGEKDTLYVPHYWGSGSFVSGKKMEVPIRKILLGQPVEKAVKRDTMRNLEALEYFLGFWERKIG